MAPTGRKRQGQGRQAAALTAAIAGNPSLHADVVALLCTDPDPAVRERSAICRTVFSRMKL